MQDSKRELYRRRRQKCVSCIKATAAFLFSHIGLAAMVVAYSIMGGFLFKALESPYEVRVKLEIIQSKEDKIEQIWQYAAHLNLENLDKGNFTERVRAIFLTFQKEVTTAVKENGWDGKDSMEESMLQWSFAGALLYAVTVITTIGYGHVAPKTTWGRLITILYALVGIPLTFLYLSNIGNVLAEGFRLFYKRICCDLCCCQQCERKKKRERLRTRRRRELAAQRNSMLRSPTADTYFNMVDETMENPECQSVTDHMSDNADDHVIHLAGSHDHGSPQNSEDIEQAAGGTDTECPNGCPSSPSSKTTLSSAAPSPTTPTSPTIQINNIPFPDQDSIRETDILDDESADMTQLKETAILDDDLSDDIRETDILDDDFDDFVYSNPHAVRTPDDQTILDNLYGLASAKETDIIDDDDDDEDYRDDDVFLPAEDADIGPSSSSIQKGLSHEPHIPINRSSKRPTETNTSKDRRKKTSKDRIRSKKKKERSKSREKRDKSRSESKDKKDKERKDRDGKGKDSFDKDSERNTHADNDIDENSKLKRDKSVRAKSKESKDRSKTRDLDDPDQCKVDDRSKDGGRDKYKNRKIKDKEKDRDKNKERDRDKSKEQGVPKDQSLIPDNTKKKDPILKDRTPSKEEKTVISKDRTPSKEEKTVISKDKTPSKEEKTVISKDRTPSKEEKSVISKDRAPSKKDKTATSKDRAPSKEETKHQLIAQRSSSQKSSNYTDGDTEQTFSRSRSVRRSKKDNTKGGKSKGKKKWRVNSKKRKSGDEEETHKLTDPEGQGYYASDESFVTAHSESFAEEINEAGPSDTEAEKLGLDGIVKFQPDVHAGGSPYDMELIDYDIKDATPLGFVEDPFEFEEEEQTEKVTVPISICLILIAGYIFAGAVLFTLWEDWDYLTGSYFCFITLSTIGFGDIVPGTDMSEWSSHEKLVLCALWLAFGLSLLAMCFNLMQEEVKEKCKWLGTKLGILKNEDEG